ncbi:g3199 [Coccomyxa viridis]|uniref:G3199 protein n=1 Tax=Coccomyxa viridis TaxID=1274662 RepID=A0ABP1FQQ2_9CHLO
MATLLWLWAALAVLGGPLLAGAAKYNGPGGAESDNDDYPFPCVPGPGSDAACTTVLQSAGLLSGINGACAPQPGQSLPYTQGQVCSDCIPKYNCEHFQVIPGTQVTPEGSKLTFNLLAAVVSPDPATWIQKAKPQFFQYTQVGPNYGTDVLTQTVTYGQSVTSTYTITTDVSLSVTASVEFDEDLIFASAKESLSVEVTASLSQTYSTSTTTQFSVASQISAGGVYYAADPKNPTGVVGDCITAIGYTALTENFVSSFTYTNYATATRNYIGANGGGTPRNSWVTDMDSYAIQIGNKLGSNTLFSNDTLPYSLLQEIRTSINPGLTGSSPDGSFIICHTTGKQSTSEGVLSSIASCPCGNQTCINNVLQSGTDFEANGEPMSFRAENSFLSPLTVTDSAGAPTSRTILTRSLPNVTIVDNGGVPGYKFPSAIKPSAIKSPQISPPSPPHDPSPRDLSPVDVASGIINSITGANITRPGNTSHTSKGTFVG